MIKLPQPVTDTIQKLTKAKFEAYVVGGSVRDLLLGLTTNNWDLTTNATPEEIQKLFPDSFYNNEFGTVGVPVKNEQGETATVLEITTYRSEKGYSDRRRPDQVIWGDSLEKDLSRRDFTVNAIAYDGKNLIDPFNGQKDLDARIIRTVGDAKTRFSEDALRLLRAIRIGAKLGFTIDEHTFHAIKENAQLIENVSPDRVRSELMNLLAGDHPADGIMLLKNAGLLHEILPEVERGFGIPQKSPKRHHIYDVGTHLVMSLHNCPSTNPLVRFATLLHDVGKPDVFHKDDASGLITFYNHEVVGAKIVKEIAYRLNFSKKDREKLITLVRWHQFTVDENQTDATLRRFIKRVGKENLKDMLDLRIGDRLGGGARETSWRLRLFMARLEEVQKQPFTVADLKVSGHDVMKLLNLQPGPEVGKVLNELFNEVVMEKIPNEREALLAKIK
ncbi:CCA tRNA nucleotidyltransferase [Candidatus Microgenomates bacterium]|nr:MAG: CCA tRNA nucleotidyltransferase [Candidatus Microgenomates bacterium]